MRTTGAALGALLLAAVTVAGAAPASASEPIYPVICLHMILPGGVPLPEVCLPYPF
ncbi:MAG: hypothetical protein QOD07_2761 [Frankiaceae bacterium]|jgi:hypothetical protein|nr:hypothetical protein [Frankiaceae bacterium]